MNDYYYGFIDSNPVDIVHFGTKGMKWGIRKYQNSDGSYTAAGKARYGIGDGKSYSSVKGSTASYKKKSRSGSKASSEDLGKLRKRMNDLMDRDYDVAEKSGKDYKPSKEYTKALNDYNKAIENYKPEKKKLTTKQKVAIGVGAAAAVGTAVAVNRYYKKNKRSANEVFDKLSDMNRTLDSSNSDVLKTTAKVSDLISNGKYKQASNVGQRFMDDYIKSGGYKNDYTNQLRKNAFDTAINLFDMT